MKSWRRRKDSELWPDTELGVLFPDGSLRIDKNPKTEFGIIVSDKFKQVYRMKAPIPVSEWRRCKELGAQPVPTGKRMWIMTGDPSDRPTEEEFRQSCELVSLDATNRSLEASNRRRWAEWWVVIGTSISVAALNSAKILDFVLGWW